MFQMLLSFAGHAVGRVPSPWLLFLLFFYTIYLFCALIVPSVANAAAGILMVMGLCGAYRFKTYFYMVSVAEKWLLISYALFSLVSIVSFFYWPQNRDARMHLEDYLTFLMLVPLYFLLRQFRINFNGVVFMLAIVSISLGIVSVAQYVGVKYFQTFLFGFDRGWSSVLRPSGGVNPMRYAAISLIFAAFSLNYILLVRHKRNWMKLISSLAVIMGFIACFLTQSRGTFISIPILAFACGVYLYRAGHPRFLLVLVVGALLFVGGVSQNSRVQSTIDSVVSYHRGDSNSNLGSRLDMFEAAVILIGRNPAWGHGLNSYSRNASEIRKNTPGMDISVGMWNNPHNEILLVMVEKGVVGLITLLLLFAAPAYLFLQELRKADESSSGQQVKFYAMCGLSLLIVYAVAGQSVALFEHDVFNHFFALMVLLFASQIRVIGYMEERCCS
ncbi:MAG: O-antigen ligase family protein [Bermanella sp.]